MVWCSMDIWGIYIEINYFVIAVISGVTLSGVLYWLQRKAFWMYRFSLYKLVISVVGITFAVYYILNVIFGGVRSGWP